MRISLLIFAVFVALAIAGGKNQTIQSCEPRVVTTETELDGPAVQIEWISSEVNDDDVVFFRTTTGSIYRSGNGGKDTLIQSDLTQGESTISRIYLTASEKKVFFKVRGISKSFWTSSDLGDHYNAKSLPFIPLQFYPHPTNADYILALTYSAPCFNHSSAGVCRHDLWVTQDFGDTWKLIKQYVNQASWGNAGNNGVPEANVLVTTWKNPTGNQNSLDEYTMTFERSNDLFETKEYSLDHFIVFLYYHETIFLAKRDSENPQAGLELHVSTDDGYTFNQAIFPSGADLGEKRYTIVDLSEGSAFVNVDHSPNGKWGYVYGSNSFDTDFSLILKYNVRGYFGTADFKRVFGLDGVYIANRFQDEADSANIETVISFDKGGEWEPLPLPNKTTGDCTDPKQCALQLYGRTEVGSHSDMYSNQNATGLIISAGSVGPWLSNVVEEVGLFFTRDAGLSWDQVRKGEYVFEFADQGAITVAANAMEETTSLLYSWNEGLNWTECKFGSELVDVQDVVTEPTSTGRSFILYGSRERKGVVVHVDFNNFHERECSTADYETWSPSDHRGGSCLLGQKYTYTRRKRAAACFNSVSVERPKYVTQCNCTAEDYECDFCFVRDNGSGSCLLDKEECGTYNPNAVPAECNNSWLQTQGYRRVSGDMCRPTNESRSKFDPIERTCESTTGIPSDGHGGGNNSSSNGAYIGLIVAGVLVLILFGVALGLGVVLLVASRNEKFRDAFKGYVPLGAQYGKVGQLEPDTLLGGLEDDDDEDQFFDTNDAPGLSDSEDDDFDPRV